MTACMGDVVIELPKHDPEYRRAPVGYNCAVYEFRWGSGLTMLDDVVAVSLHIEAGALITAEVTQRYLASSLATHNVALVDRVTRWTVAGFRERA